MKRIHGSGMAAVVECNVNLFICFRDISSTINQASLCRGPLAAGAEHRRKEGSISPQSGPSSSRILGVVGTNLRICVRLLGE